MIDGHIVGFQGGNVKFDSMDYLDEKIKDILDKDKLCNNLCSSDLR